MIKNKFITFILLIITIFIISFNSNSQSLSEYIYNLKGLSKNNDTIYIFQNEYKYTVVIFYSYKCCHDCFINTGIFFSKLKGNKNIKVIIYCEYQKFALPRKEIRYMVNKYFKNKFEIYFDIVEQNKFLKNFYSNTPSLLIWNNYNNKVEKEIYYFKLINKEGFLQKDAKNYIQKFFNYYSVD